MTNGKVYQGFHDDKKFEEHYTRLIVLEEELVKNLQLRWRADQVWQVIKIPLCGANERRGLCLKLEQIRICKS